MPKITVDGVMAHSEDLSEEGRHILETLQFLEREMQRLNQQIQVVEDSKAALLLSLQGTLPRTNDDEQG